MTTETIFMALYVTGVILSFVYFAFFSKKPEPGIVDPISMVFTVAIVCALWPIIILCIPLMYWDDKRNGHEWFKKK